MLENRRIIQVITLACLAAVATPFLLDKYGISNDTLTYTSTAHNLVAGNGYVAANGTVPVEFAPLYPLILAFGFSLGLTDGLALGFVNVAATALLMYALRNLGAVRNMSSLETALLMGAVGFGYPMLYVAHWGWSEYLFVALVVSAWVQVERISHGDNRLRTFAAAIAFTALFCLTRYAGVIFVVAMTFRMFLTPARFRAMVFAVAGLAPLSIWLLINKLSNRSTAGERGPSQIDILESIDRASGVVAKWFIGPVPLGLRYIAFTALVVAAVIVLSKRHSASSVVAIALFYGAAIVTIAGGVTGISPPNDRLLSPLYPFAVIAVFSFAKSKQVQILNRALTIWVSCIVLSGVALTVNRVAS